MTGNLEVTQAKVKDICSYASLEKRDFIQGNYIVCGNRNENVKDEKGYPRGVAYENCMACKINNISLEFNNGKSGIISSVNLEKMFDCEIRLYEVPAKSA